MSTNEHPQPSHERVMAAHKALHAHLHKMHHHHHAADRKAQELATQDNTEAKPSQ